MKLLILKAGRKYTDFFAKGREEGDLPLGNSSEFSYHCMIDVIKNLCSFPPFLMMNQCLNKLLCWFNNGVPENVKNTIA